jgi:hypothetical protein
MDKVKKPLTNIPKLTEEQLQARKIKNQRELDFAIQRELNKLLPDKKYLNTFKI